MDINAKKMFEIFTFAIILSGLAIASSISVVFTTLGIGTYVYANLKNGTLFLSITGGIAFLLTCIFSGSFIGGIYFFIMIFMSGSMLNRAIERKWNIEKMVISVSLTNLISAIVQAALTGLVGGGLSIGAVFNENIDTIIKILSDNFSNMLQTTSDPGVVAMIKDFQMLIPEITKMLKLLLPGQLISTAFLISIASIFVLKAVMKRGKLDPTVIAQFQWLRGNRMFVSFFAICIILTAIPVDAIKIASYNLIYLCIAVAAVFGISLIEFFLNMWKVQKWLKILIYLVIIMVALLGGLLIFLFTLLGLIDGMIDIRKISKHKEV